MSKFFVTQLTNRGDTFETHEDRWRRRARVAADIIFYEALAAAKAKANDPKANGAVFAVIGEDEVVQADAPAQD